MLGEDSSWFKRAFPLIGLAYLLFLTTREPPVSWMGIACLVIITPFVIGWALGRFVGIGPWAPATE